ncbi:ABC-F family ATP-binding cassette domain-containing protein [Terasakiella sp. A23]|uniref:ABC-F family ATP-binding cassette domain-containing protein n=1 Tax=Terasakiella sp. FCG-A23 TaxID=3080561 RepID=UPI0029544EEF|nr:ABC-F family ATP-binding cassette domain-containing protein [Terasakiella sp. A23]MDV7340190.1 ABC-F family ATP-binding cassette domain-containing protein [Terasakiella sp. A23]
MLHINDLTYRIGGRMLFDQATVVVPAGHKVGLVGKNGTGKSTLFKLILEEVSPDDGVLSVQRRARVGRVAQEAPTGNDSLIDTVLKADLERDSLLKEAETCIEPNRIGEIHARLADIDAHTAPARAATILGGLGFDHEAQQRPCSDFSGGWQMRVALAAALFAKPDLLLLDEPTNHLDLEAVMWLEEYLKRYQGTILVISHERTLLNNVVDEIIHLEHCKLTRYGGNYDTFEKTRREKLALVAKAQSKQLAQRKHLQSFIDRFKAKATKAKQAQSRVKMLERMEPIASVMEEKTYSFNFPDPEPLSSPLISMEDTSAGYEPGKPILKKLSLRVDMDDRIALLGANGNGKSTLIKLLSSRLAPLEGQVRKSSKLKIGYFAQHQTDELNVSKTPYDHMAQLMPDAVESKVRAQLGRFGFEGDKADSKIEKLSGGEKARLLFALMSFEAPHLMFLDEPTNHLDVDSREALVQAINTYDGAVVMVSHDPHLLELTCDRLWIVENGGCRAFEGDLEEYKRQLIESRKPEKKTPSSGDQGSTNQKKASRQDRAAQRAAQAPLRKAAKEAEKKVEAFTAEKEKLEIKLADPKIYEGPSEKLQALQIKLGEVNSALEEAEMEWLEAAEALENAD